MRHVTKVVTPAPEAKCKGARVGGPGAQDAKFHSVGVRFSEENRAVPLASPVVLHADIDCWEPSPRLGTTAERTRPQSQVGHETSLITTFRRGLVEGFAWQLLAEQAKARFVDLL